MPLSPDGDIRRKGRNQKPELAAPGVEETTAPSPGGGYQSNTGTSFAVPFVNGKRSPYDGVGHCPGGNDPYLYGEKVKAYLRKGARPPAGRFAEYPNISGGGMGVVPEGEYAGVKMFLVCKIGTCYNENIFS